MTARWRCVSSSRWTRSSPSIPETTDTETGILAAFDAARERIFAVAAKVYESGRHQSDYTLTADRFSRVAAA